MSIFNEIYRHYTGPEDLSRVHDSLTPDKPNLFYPLPSESQNQTQFSLMVKGLKTYPNNFAVTIKPTDLPYRWGLSKISGDFHSFVHLDPQTLKRSDHPSHLPKNFSLHSGQLLQCHGFGGREDLTIAISDDKLVFSLGLQTQIPDIDPDLASQS